MAVEHMLRRQQVSIHSGIKTETRSGVNRTTHPGKLGYLINAVVMIELLRYHDKNKHTQSIFLSY